MTTPLHIAIHATADEAPAYDVLEGAIVLGRRRRRRAAIGAAAAVLVIVSLVGGAAVGLVDAPRVTSSGGPDDPAAVRPARPSLPDRIGSPALFNAGVIGSPPGPASLIFREHDNIVTVGAASDVYRMIDSSADPGRTALLSPDGTQVAYRGDHRITIVNLGTGKSRNYLPPAARADLVTPMLWLSDSSGLVVLSTTYAKDPTTEGRAEQLDVMFLPDGGSWQLAAATWPIGPAGFTVAVNPGSTRYAYQYANFITVSEPSSGAKVVLTMPDGRTALAGKGAWTPDGRSLAVIHRDLTDPSQRRWEIRLLDPATGTERDPSARYSMTGMSLIRLLGWDARTGNPIVVGYEAAGAVDDELGYGGPVLLVDTVNRVGVYELSRSGAPRTLVQPAAGVTGIDVADFVVTAAETRPGHPPAWLSPVGIAALGLAVLLIVGMAAWWLRRRRRLR